MYIYKLYNLYFVSPFKIKYLLNITDSNLVNKSNSVRIIHDNNLSELKLEKLNDIQVKSSKNLTQINKQNKVYIEITDGCLIKYKLIDQSYKNEQLARFIINNALGYILYQRDNFVIHASAVIKNEKAIVFMGRSGSGKSTLASSFIKDRNFVSEDISLIGLNEQSALISPSFPLIKLSSDKSKLPNLKFSNIYKLKGDYLNRNYFEISENFTRLSEVEISCCYILGWSDKRCFIKPSVEEIIHNFYVSTFTSFPHNTCAKSSKEFLRNIETFCKNVPIYLFKRKKGFIEGDVQFINNHSVD